MKVTILAYVIFLTFMAISWFTNLGKLIDCNFEQPYKAEIIHSVGIFPIVACVTAWVDIDDTPEVKE